MECRSARRRGSRATPATIRASPGTAATWKCCGSVDRALPFRPSVRLGRVGGDGIGEEIWSDRWIDADNFDLAAQPAGQTIIARGPAAALVVGVISFDIWMPPRRRTAA